MIQNIEYMETRKIINRNVIAFWKLLWSFMDLARDPGFVWKSVHSVDIGFPCVWNGQTNIKLSFDYHDGHQEITNFTWTIFSRDDFWNYLSQIWKWEHNGNHQSIEEQRWPMIQVRIHPDPNLWADQRWPHQLQQYRMKAWLVASDNPSRLESRHLNCTVSGWVVNQLWRGGGVRIIFCRGAWKIEHLPPK